MNRQELIKAISAYVPYNAQEAADKENILAFLTENEDAFLRSNEMAHMTASAWVVNREKTKVLMVYHKIYDSWSWTGGHADGETDLLAVALREVREETGVKTVFPLSDDIFSLEALTVDRHEKHGQYVPSHLHLNITYLLEADEKETLTVCKDENKAVAWFSLEDALRASTEPWFVARIYRKLNDKLCSLYKN
ncbi:MAG: NUDIX hydrolase [Oscillospiraceae bacterium]|nr:NUDIX hydrolase [Oscillospiraceae bacterium]